MPSFYCWSIRCSGSRDVFKRRILQSDDLLGREGRSKERKKTKIKDEKGITHPGFFFACSCLISDSEKLIQKWLTGNALNVILDHKCESIYVFCSGLAFY